MKCESPRGYRGSSPPSITFSLFILTHFADISSGESMSPTRSIRADMRSFDDSVDMLCPICEDSCSCAGKAELKIYSSKSFKNNKHLRKQILKKRPNKKKKLQIPISSTNNSAAVPSAAQNGKTDGKIGGTNRKNLADKNDSKSKTQAKTSTCLKGEKPSYYDTRMNFDLDAQFALSEFYFSGNEDSSDFDQQLENEEDAMMEVNDSDVLAEYYGYSSGTDMAMQSLFGDSTDDDDDDTIHDEFGEEDDDGEGTNGNSDDEDHSIDEADTLLLATITESRKNEPIDPDELLTEQLAKITPQILAAISVAAKTISSNTSHHSHHHHHHHHHHHQQHNQNISSHQPIYHGSYSMVLEDCCSREPSLRLEELMDTKKLSMILSTSPPQNEWITSSMQRRSVPIDAFRRRRRNSLQNPNLLSNALRSNSTASCTLAEAPSWLTQSADTDIEIDLQMEIDTDEGRGRKYQHEADEEEEIIYDITDYADFDVFTWSHPSILL